MTYDTFMSSRAVGTAPVRGVPGLAVRLGRALEKWGRDAARTAEARSFETVDPRILARELARQEREKTRMLATQSQSLRHW